MGLAHHLADSYIHVLLLEFVARDTVTVLVSAVNILIPGKKMVKAKLLLRMSLFFIMLFCISEFVLLPTSTVCSASVIRNTALLEPAVRGLLCMVGIYTSFTSASKAAGKSVPPPEF